MQVQFDLFGYALNGAFYSVLTILLIVGWRNRLHHGILTFAAFVTAAWSLLLSWFSIDPASHSIGFPVEYFSEVARSGAWLLVTAAVFGESSEAVYRSPIQRYAIILALLVTLGVAALGAAHYLGLYQTGELGLLVLNLIVIDILGLLMIEQVFRNAVQSVRKVLKFLLLGIGIIFAYDLAMLSSSIFTGGLSPLLWASRGYVFVVTAPMIAFAVRRMPNWSTDIFVSRHVVFYTASLTGLGIYLVVLAFIGEVVRLTGGSWGGATQLLLLISGTAAIAYLVLSERRRAQIRVLVDKHFFRNKYDYRTEWLRLIRLLTGDDENSSLRERSARALAYLVGSESSEMWLIDKATNQYVPRAAWNTRLPDTIVGADDAIVSFLRDSRWIVDVNEYRLNPSHYDPLSIDESQLDLARTAFIVPLVHQSSLLGFVTLEATARKEPLNYEDHDLLKTVGYQIAGYLSLELLTEELAEARQFEAFNKLTAFLMHDLKNVLAQQSMVLDNAKLHKHRPEFIDDALATIENSVARLKRVLDQLAQKSPDTSASRVDVNRALLKATSACADGSPQPMLDQDGTCTVRVDGEKFLMVLTNLIRNAQEATPPEGSVRVLAREDGSVVSVVVEDSGRGMSEEFVRDRLFRPFDSTKGVSGMGIGAYQAREFARASGGRLRVESTPGKGTRVTVELPAANTGSSD